jgi:hypothetical protein
MVPKSGRTTTSRPAKPIRMAAQRLRPTRSPRIGSEIAATISGAVLPITCAVVSGR